jgi:DNA N-6-adenine-methyltransferase (Dam)
VAVAKSKMNSDEWCTPSIVAQPLEQFFDGPVDLDCCTNPNSIINATRGYTAGALHLPWRLPGTEGSVWRNNPYSCSEIWVDKAVRELNAVYPVTEEVSLVMVATSTRWWRKMCGTEPVMCGQQERISPIPRLLFTGRLKFIGDVDSGARFDTVLAYYGHRVRAFEKEFKSVTKWSTWGR